MSGFLYFKPGQPSVNAEKAKDWGLGYAFTTRACGGQCQGQTPSGGAGIVFADKQRMGESPIKMDMPNQVWGKIPQSDVWVGYWKDAPPTPEDLEREHQLPGYFVPLADGRRWLMPTVRRFDRSQTAFTSALPCYMEVDADGKWSEGRVLGIHAHLWDLTTPYADELFRANTEDGFVAREFTKQELCDAVAVLLQTNYAVGVAELSLMRALTNEEATKNAILFSCEVPVFLEWLVSQKKSNQSTQQDSLNTDDGNQD